MNEIVNSVHFLKQQKWVDLSHSIYGGIPYFQSFQPMQEKTLVTVKNDGFFAKEYQLVTQYGTHIDAPVHFVEDRVAVDQLPIKDFLLPLIVINKEKEVAENPDYSLTVEDILTFEEEHGNIQQKALSHLPVAGLNAGRIWRHSIMSIKKGRPTRQVGPWRP